MQPFLIQDTHIHTYNFQFKLVYFAQIKLFIFHFCYNKYQIATRQIIQITLKCFLNNLISITNQCRLRNILFQTILKYMPARNLKQQIKTTHADLNLGATLKSKFAFKQFIIYKVLYIITSRYIQLDTFSIYFPPNLLNYANIIIFFISLLFLIVISILLFIFFFTPFDNLVTHYSFTYLPNYLHSLVHTYLYDLFQIYLAQIQLNTYLYKYFTILFLPLTPNVQFLTLKCMLLLFDYLNNQIIQLLTKNTNHYI
ncbi:transmembrane protein, putative (macronuclear) [Tetrahymena thermophila SB210]|uniref:Transmembrane protein, putative n=1 Tax=Tetrahymena thermophila (strain SB210) TaxID=312017 RepID=W7XGW4_TETTS|nr:transmembrane protein, putative [Tetrahymena thermophila SB210]EWS73506.1 transmembrane protein, putative [Tetrahymena thermophila SB210]|eukprot:XP_012653988.1 transmembrane protein, putative [Tetrahymena thermophila SB210]